MNPTEADTFMARLEAGHSLRMLTGGAGEPPICSADAFRKHCELNPEWGAKALALVEANSKSRIQDGIVKRTTDRTACNQGHPLSPEIIARMQAERRYDHRWCEACARRWQGVGRYFAEEADVIAPPANVERLTLSSGSRFLSADDIALIESWLIKGASLRKLLGAWDAIRFRLALKNNPDLESRLRPIIERNAKVAVVVASRKRRISHCKYGHELSIENTGIKPSNGSRFCLTCNRTFAGAPVTPQMLDNVERGLLTGMSVGDLTTPRDGKRPTITYAQWRTVRRTRPDINERFMRALRNPATIRSFMSGNTIARVPGLTLAAPADFVRSDVPLYIPQEGDTEWLLSLTPHHWSDADRMDVVGNIFLALVDRKLRREDVPVRMKEFKKQHNDMFSDKDYGSARAPLSLDVPIFAEGRTTRGETIKTGLWSPESIY
ncbi:hypothetical protein JJB99_24545 [Bradyrhizobium diazoefficiens]|uniref:hypothetical protein n=1 Tax=Bradyrhizobium diazoefficiens TaxID=1355477 RepID=UPI0019094E12|nr:hypothetical protein [Bradyrhizobium diazoefficiens]QQO12616.1 hypothetical protein JJB99_24545 [Bradyrhizobium diazoefficiens]